MARRTNDAYFTPAGSLGPALELARFPRDIKVLEPSAGTGNLVDELRAEGYSVWANDFFVRDRQDSFLDLRCQENWGAIRHLTPPGTDAVIGNPPYLFAPEFVRCALRSGHEHVFYLLRLSWLERCQNRSDLCDSGMLRAVIVTPRLSFTGDGRRDTCTTAWFWYDSSYKGDPLVRWLK